MRMVLEESSRKACGGWALRTAGVVAGGVLALALGGLLAGSAGPAWGQVAGGAKAGRSEAAQGVEFQQRVNASLGLLSSEVVRLAVEPMAGVGQRMRIALGGQQYTLELEPHSVRAAGYRLLVDVGAGELVEAEPGVVNTLRGRLVEAPGSTAAGGMLDDGLHVTIRLADGSAWWVEPLIGRVEGAAADQYAVYRSEDVIHPEGFCGVQGVDFDVEIPAAAGEGGIAGALTCAQLACDADFEFYTAHGSNVTNVENRINLVINTMNNQYENQVGLRHMITTIIVRSNSNDPYTTSNPEALLSQFANYWAGNHGDVVRDVAHLFTGRNLSGTVIGIAYLGTVCTGTGYSLVQSDCCGSLACATDLSAHELGHNWSATHCSCPSSTMNAGLTCANSFNAGSISQITNYANNVGCLSSCEDGMATLPLIDTFPTTSIDGANWTGVDGATVNGLGMNEPSSPNSLNLDGSASGGDEIRSAIIDASNVTHFTLEYYYQRRGGGDQPEAGDDLVFEYLDGEGSWVEVSRQLGAGPAMTTFQPVMVELPPGALHSGFRLRIRVISSQVGQDDWFVDNVAITGLVPPENNSCVLATLVESEQTAFTTAGASTDGPDESGACGLGEDGQISNDVWFKYLAMCTGTVNVSLCGANFDSMLAVYTSCPASGGELIACADDTCGDDPEVSFAVTAGTLYRIRIGGRDGAMGTGTLSITCTPGAGNCPGDIDNSGTVDVADLLALVSTWGPCGGICPADVDNSGAVDVADLLTMLQHWGDCL